MKKSLYSTLTLFSVLTFAQNVPDKKFDQEIFQYLMETTEKESVTLETFLFNSKPFSKWDIRPIKVKEAKAMDSIYTSSQIPNFIWGAFSGKYNISEEEAMSKPNRFLDEGIDNQEKWTSFFRDNIKKFNDISQNILKSSHTLFLNQGTIQRIDNLYKEKNIFWSYLIDKDSFYPLSPKISIQNQKFSNEETKILDLLKNLNIYCAIKTDKGIFYLIDGFTDNSYGIYYNPKNEMEQDNHLFEIMKYKELNNSYFYYIAN